VAPSELKFSEKIAEKQSELVMSSIPYKFHLERIYDLWINPSSFSKSRSIWFKGHSSYILAKEFC